VISAAVLTKTGKVLLARQFIQITKSRIEALLAAFPKRISSDVQHTFVESEHVRYVYQPLEQLYVVLITNKASNIIEDLKTLGQLTKLIPECCGGHTEEAVLSHKYELVHAFDEMIALGHAESVTIPQVKQYLAMDSHEEALQKIILDSKMNEAREFARRKAEDIERQKAEMRRQQQMMGAYSSYTYPGQYSSSYSSSSYSLRTYEDTTVATTAKPATTVEKKPPASTTVKAGAAKGMSLSKAKKTGEDFAAQLSKEEKAAGLPVFPPGGLKAPFATSPAAAAAAAAVERTNVQVTIEEKIVVAVERDGTVKSFEVKGQLKVAVFDPDDAKLILKTSGLEREFKANVNPKVSRQAWEQAQTIQLPDPSKMFPLGSENAPVIVKWRLVSTSDSLPPFVVNCWPNPEDGLSVVSVEVTKNDKCRITPRDIRILVPCQSSEAPEVRQHDGDYDFNPKSKVLGWTIPELEDTARLEFSVPEVDDDSFFPLNISFTSDQSYSGLQVVAAQHAETGKPIEFSQKTLLSVEKFVVE